MQVAQKICSQMEKDDVEEKSFWNCRAVKNEARDIIDDERRLTMHKVAEKCGVSQIRIHVNLSQDLNMNRWVPRFLTSEYMEKRVELLCQFVKKFDKYFGLECYN